MVAIIIDLADLEATGTRFSTLTEAEQALSMMLEQFRTQGHKVTEQHVSGEDFPQFKVECDDEWVGTYTVIETD